ncbi:glycosyltransferase [Oleiharenicola lentus]|uniref:glycosyltransferase n=1 Tax=Oleiharenicola lentus TaxID=2508720 RepID=UPI003F668CF7
MFNLHSVNAVQHTVALQSNPPFSRSGSHLRIAHAIFTRNLAGSERYCVELANQQAALGHEVHVAGTRGSLIQQALSPKIKFHAVGRLFRTFRLKQLLAKIEPDVCHGHLSAACKALGALSHRHRTVATLHVGYKAHQHGRLGGVICVNHTQAVAIDGYRGRNCTVWNWLPDAPAANTSAGLRQKLGISSDMFLVGAVGRLHESKGVDVLISAFRRTAPDCAGLVILGDGPQRAALEKLAAGDPRIHFLGYRAAVHECLREFDLFVSPSREESFGLAILEAMSTGAPIISTATAGPSEFLQDQPVTLVAPGCVDEMTAALADAYARFNRGELPKLAYDLKPFKPALRVAEIMSFYEEVIHTREEQVVQSWEPAAAT